jgi:hypothetical protein
LTPPAPGWGRFGFAAKSAHYFTDWRSLCGRHTRRSGQDGVTTAPEERVCYSCRRLLGTPPPCRLRRRASATTATPPAAAAFQVLNPHEVLRRSRALRDFATTGTLTVGRGLFADLVLLAERGMEVSS